MSAAYRAVGWNRQKRVYDATLAGGVVLYLLLFLGIGFVVRPEATAETMLIRAFGTAAFLLLHVALSIGPLCRIDRRFLPLLYNRRHLGVTTFVLGAGHGLFALVQFHALGNVNPIVSLLTSNTRYESLAQFPFQVLGFVALVILFLMGATSHDFWLSNLSAPVWKVLHMLVYAAYGLLVAHVALGVLQSETSPWLAGVMGVGLAWVLGLHLVAAYRERAGDEQRSDSPVATDGFVEVCEADDIQESRAKIVNLAGERVAVFRFDGKIAAVSNVCQHQNGPLGEGKVVDGCITCPWHGYQYVPETGASPPPFTEKIPTFRVRVAGGKVLVHSRPNLPGTRVEPAAVRPPATGAVPGGVGEEFYVGYLPRAPREYASRVRVGVAGGMAAAAVLAVVLATSQSNLGPGVFEFGVRKEFEGFVRLRPYPTLLVRRPGEVGDAPAFSTYYLTASGKRGAEDLVAPHDGKNVRLAGSLVYRDARTMVEVMDGSVESVDGDEAVEWVARDGVEQLGTHTLVGEIVDSKCYLGVMKPGNLKPHRSCAARCISGGVPPVLLVRDSEGVATYFLLTSAGGQAVNRQVLDLVAEPVKITGRVVRQGELLMLEADPETYRRVGSDG